MINWRLDLESGSAEKYIQDSDFNQIWEEFKHYNGSHREFFINKVNRQNE